MVVLGCLIHNSPNSCPQRLKENQWKILVKILCGVLGESWFSRTSHPLVSSNHVQHNCMYIYPAMDEATKQVALCTWGNPKKSKGIRQPSSLCWRFLSRPYPSRAALLSPPCPSPFVASSPSALSSPSWPSCFSCLSCLSSLPHRGAREACSAGRIENLGESKESDLACLYLVQSGSHITKLYVMTWLGMFWSWLRMVGNLLAIRLYSMACLGVQAQEVL